MKEEIFLEGEIEPDRVVVFRLVDGQLKDIYPIEKKFSKAVREGTEEEMAEILRQFKGAWKNNNNSVGTFLDGRMSIEQSPRRGGGGIRIVE